MAESGPMPTLGAVLAQARARLRAAKCETPELDVRILAGAAMGIDAAALHLRGDRPVAADDAAVLEGFLARRAGGEPVYRILGRRPFYAHEFELSAGTLEPRPDTEALVDLAAEAMRAAEARRRALRFADVGTGTGAIAISLLALFPQAHGVAIDLSEDALRTAMRNASAAGVERRFSPLRCDYLAAIGGSLDVVVSNPPYIPSSEMTSLAREVRDFDPPLALDGGADGLDAYRAIAAQAAALLGADGDLLFEIGAGQAPAVRVLCAERGFAQVGARPDYAGIVRAVWFRRDSCVN